MHFAELCLICINWREKMQYLKIFQIFCQSSICFNSTVVVGTSRKDFWLALVRSWHSCGQNLASIMVGTSRKEKNFLCEKCQPGIGAGPGFVRVFRPGPETRFSGLKIFLAGFRVFNFFFRDPGFILKCSGTRNPARADPCQPPTHL